MSKMLEGIKIPPVVKELDLSEYAPGMKDIILYVWVNITNKMHEEYTEMQVKGLKISRQIEVLTVEYQKVISDKKEKKRVALQIEMATDKLNGVNVENFVWYSQVWSKHEDSSTHVTPGDVQEFANQLMADDPALWKWVTTRTQAMIVAHRNAYLKN